MIAPVPGHCCLVIFEDKTFVMIVTTPGHCLHFTVAGTGNNSLCIKCLGLSVCG